MFEASKIAEKVPEHVAAQHGNNNALRPEVMKRFSVEEKETLIHSLQRIGLLDSRNKLAVTGWKKATGELIEKFVDAIAGRSLTAFDFVASWRSVTNTEINLGTCDKYVIWDIELLLLPDILSATAPSPESAKIIEEIICPENTSHITTLFLAKR